MVKMSYMFLMPKSAAICTPELNINSPLNIMFINSSLIETIQNFEVFGQYKIRLACGRVPRPIKIWGSMRPTKCDQAQVNWTLRSGVRAKNEGKFELFAVTRKVNFCILPSLSHKLKEISVYNFVCQLCDGIEDKNQSTQNSGYPHFLSHSQICNVKARGARVYSMLQPRVRVTESLFFDQYLRSDCPVSIQVSFCTLWAKCGWYEGNFESW